MSKYKVEFTQKETFIVDVFAKNEDEARARAEEGFSAGNYQEVGDCAVEVSTVYDVSETDDPFDPIN